MATRLKLLDYYFLGLAILALVLGGIVVVRGITLGGTWQYTFFGLMLLLFGVYRIALFVRTVRLLRGGGQDK